MTDNTQLTLATLIFTMILSAFHFHHVSAVDRDIEIMNKRIESLEQRLYEIESEKREVYGPVERIAYTAEDEGFSYYF